MAKRTESKGQKSPAKPVKSDPLVAVRRVYEWICEGNNEFALIEKFRLEFPDLDAATVLPQVMERFKQAADFESDVLVGWCLESARDVYRRMILANDLQGALKAVKLIADLAACKSA